jgi:hypothetical protein
MTNYLWWLQTGFRHLMWFCQKEFHTKGKFKSNCYKVHGTNCRYRSELVNCNPDPNVAVGHLCDPLVEMVIRFCQVMQPENIAVEE